MKNFTWRLVFAITVCSIGCGFPFGYNIGVLNNPEKVIKSHVQKDMKLDNKNMNFSWSLLVALLPLGALIGGAFTGPVCLLLGRRGGLMANSILAIIGGLLCALSKMTNTYLLYVGRFICGLNCGLNAGLGPVFLNEIPPTSVRGAVGSLFQLNITISILVSQILGFEVLFGSEKLWPVLFIVIVVVAVLKFLGLVITYESPKQYLEKGDEEKARKVSEKLIGPNYEDHFAELKKDIDDAKKMPAVTVKEMFTQKKLRKPLIIICSLMAAQQFSGINAVMFYSTQIFAMAKFSEKATQISTIGVGLVNVLVTIASVWLVELSGRKLLLLIAFGGMVVTTVLLFVSLYFVEKSSFIGVVSILMVYLYVVCFAIGAGGVPWILGPELFNTAARPLACSFAVPTNWTCAFVVGLIFPPLREKLGPAVFIIFIVCNVIAFLFIWVFVPETKNRPIDEITALFE